MLVLEAGPYIDRDSYPEEPLAALIALYRDGGLDGRRGPPGDPDARSAAPSAARR